MAKNILGFKEFKQINEAKKERTNVELFIEDVENIIDDMFSEHKNIQYKIGNKFISAKDIATKNKIPDAVKFMVDEQDYKLDYPDKIDNEYGGGILSKRKEVPTIDFNRKWKNEEKFEFWIEFEIIKTKVTKEMIEDAYEREEKDDDDDKDEEKEEKKEKKENKKRGKKKKDDDDDKNEIEDIEHYIDEDDED